MNGAARCTLLLSPQAPMWARAQALPPGWLTDSEWQRQSGMRPQRQREFIACRYALRLLLAGSAGGVPAWRLAAPPGGAPLVETGAGAAHAREGATCGLHLSLSHSADWLACASAAQPVGVDLECGAKASRARDLPVLAELVCSPPERGGLRTLDGAAALQRWVQLWCLKEAYCKSVGSGLEFARIRALAWCPVEQGRQAGPAPSARRIAHGRTWQGMSVLGDPVCLAVCAEHPIASVEWRGAGGVTWMSMSEWHLWEPHAGSVPPGDRTTMEYGLR